ncbi:MAG: ribosomal protein [Actinomycetota bacterium]|jgi:small subunit ribosomal protein S18
MAKAAPKRGKNKDNARRSKKKISLLSQEKVDYVDYKDINLLRRFMSDRAKIRARRVSGNDSQQQKEIARAIKNAREMALLPYTNRVTTQRGGRDRGERRGDNAEVETMNEDVNVDIYEAEFGDVEEMDVEVEMSEVAES